MSDWAPTESRLDYFKNGLAQQLDVTAQLRSDLAEARAEVAALRGDRDRFAMLRCCEMAEWQAAKRAEEQLLRLQTTAEFGELATARSAWEAAAVAREDIEASMLAADLGEEVGRG